MVLVIQERRRRVGVCERRLKQPWVPSSAKPPDDLAFPPLRLQSRHQHSFKILNSSATTNTSFSLQCPVQMGGRCVHSRHPRFQREHLHSDVEFSGVAYLDFDMLFPGSLQGNESSQLMHKVHSPHISICLNGLHLTAERHQEWEMR